MVLISGNGTNLKALLNAQGNVLRTGRIARVVSSSPIAKGVRIAEENRVPCSVIDRQRVSMEQFELQVSKIIEEYDIGLVVLDGFVYILSCEFVAKYRGRIINIHPSLLPLHGGKGMYGIKVHQEVLRCGDTESGATAHYVSEEVDGGEIIMQEKINVLRNDTAETLQKRILSEVEWKLYPLAVERVCEEISEKK